MFASFLKQITGKVLLVTVALVGTTAVGTVPAAAQTPGPRQFALSSNAQHILADLLSGMPADVQRLVLSAMQSLGPNGAEAKLSQLAQLDTVAPGFVRTVGPRIIVPYLQLIPPQLHQAFVNGLFGVSQPEEQYAAQVLNSALARLMQTSDPYQISRPDPQLRTPSGWRGLGTPQSNTQPTPQLALSPAGQQAVSRVLSILPPDVQQLWLNSVRALGPDRIEPFLALLNTKSLDELRMEVQTVMSILRSLPPQEKQIFMNGIVGVSQADEEFVNQVMQGITAENSQIRDTARRIQDGNRVTGALRACEFGPNPCVIHVYPH